jgi:hypothetical protein
MLIEKPVYVAPNGQLMYTAARSSFMPRGAKGNRFTKEPFPGMDNLELLKWDGMNFVTCPQLDGTYKIYVPRTKGTDGHCLPFRFATFQTPGPKAWQYN